MLTAVVAMALLALASVTLLDGARGTAAQAGAGIERARMVAAADGAVNFAVTKLSAPRGERWGIDARPHALAIGGIDVVVTVEDERGRIPVNQITEEQTRAMFEALGLSGPALDTAVDSLLDWIDDDDDVRADGAEAGYYAQRGIVPRNGMLRSVDELSVVRGISPALVARLRGEISVFRDSNNGFDDRYARPLALAVMSGSALASPEAIARARELAGDRVAIDLADAGTLVGRPLQIRVDARGPGSARLQRRVSVELTGRRSPAYIVRGLG
ncbi:MAG TPA: type II secretion system protein GspK [Polymorphobacter sp.]|nr:type II secretion system protein GspK [Polymorphobacter sp.]